MHFSTVIAGKWVPPYLMGFASMLYYTVYYTVRDTNTHFHAVIAGRWVPPSPRREIG